MVFVMVLAWAAMATIWDSPPKMVFSPTTKIALKFFNPKAPATMVLDQIVLSFTGFVVAGEKIKAEDNS
jgi:hypothetical protein